MSAGGPNDHPVSDILDYKIEVYGEVCDNLIRQISGYVSRDSLLGMYDWFDNSNLDNLSEFESTLKVKLGALKQEAESKGWEAKS